MSAAPFVLRPFRPDDLAAIRDLWVASWREAGFAFDFDARREWLAARLTALEAGGVAILVGLDARGRPAGFVALDPASGALDQLCVAPALKGAGLACALLDAAKARSPGVIALDVNETNARARRFYEREGFAIVGRGSSALSGLPTLRMTWTARPPHSAA